MDPLQNNPSYQQIPITTLAPERLVGIKLFLRTGHDRYVLFLNESSLLSTSKIEKLKENNVSHLYLSTEDRQGYMNYIKKNLATILDNPELTESNKASIIYETASDITEELFLKPSSESIEQARNLVDCMIDTISQSPKTSNLLMMITNQDYYTYTHSINVGIYAVSMTRKIMPTISDADLKTLGLGYFLHDLGKAKIPNDIINKKGALDQDEWHLMQEHPALGAELAKEMKTDDPTIIDIIISHHERCSGTGYPGKRTQKEISLPGKVCAFCDVFDALTTKRSYKKALTTFEALKIIRNDTPDHFEAELLNPFILLFSQQ